MRFGFNRLMGLMANSAAALIATASFGLDFRGAKDLPKDKPLYKAPHAKKSSGRSKSKGAPDRLILDRSNTVHKMQRWLNSGSLVAPQPKTDRHLRRHGWWRRQNLTRMQAEEHVKAVIAAG